MGKTPNAQYNLAEAASVAIRVSTIVRRRMFQRFLEQMTPQPDATILDLGVTSENSYGSSNYFEELYPFKDRITAAGLDDARFLETRYPGVRFVHADAMALPFADAAFDFVHSSAVLEHVGSRMRQGRMIGECLRVARRGICITTPNRWFPIEFHTQIPFLHWLPPRIFRAILRRMGHGFLAQEDNLNLISAAQLRSLAEHHPGWRFHLIRQRLFGITSNLLLFAWRDPE